MYQGFYPPRSSTRVVPFAGPFLLGALTGGVATAIFNPYRPRPFYGPPVMQYGNYGFGGYVPF